MPKFRAIFAALGIILLWLTLVSSSTLAQDELSPLEPLTPLEPISSLSADSPQSEMGWGVVNIWRVSVASDGTQGNDRSWLQVMSEDGRYVAFESSASNLVPNDTNNAQDTFLHDRVTGETTRISVASDGTQANGGSYVGAITPDGRYVLFTSQASNLVPNDTDGVQDAFVHDRVTGETTRVSVASDGTQGNDYSGGAGISADGRYVFFGSAADNLVPDDTNGRVDAFVHDRVTGETTRVSVASDGTQMSGGFIYVNNMSDDGRYVTFWSNSPDLVPDDTNGTADVFVHDRVTAETTRVSVASDGTQGNGWSESPHISADGRYVTFQSSANNLVPDDTNNVRDVFVHDRVTGETTRISVAPDGTQTDRRSELSYISGDGRYVVFESSASTLMPDGLVNDPGIFVHDRQTGRITRASITLNGLPMDSYYAWRPSISPDGKFVAFSTDASNLVPGDTNGVMDVFVVELGEQIAAPLLNSPAQDAIIPDLSPIFSWQAVADVTGYEIQISTVSNFSSIHRSANLGATELEWTVTPALVHGVYYWRVRAEADGEYGFWSSPRTLSINSLTPPPLLSPEHEIINPSNNPPFTWESVNDATAYDIQISTSSNFMGIHRSASRTVTNWTVSPTLTSGIYYWRVRAKKGVLLGPWSEVRSLTILILTPPTLSSPASNAIVFTKTPELVWNSSANATGYDVQISNVSNFASVYLSTSQTDTSWVVSSPLSNGTWYWRVRSTNGDFFSNWSSGRSVRVNSLSIPVLVSPEDLATFSTTTPELTWESVDEASAYEVQVSISSNFSPVQHSATRIETNWTVEPVLTTGLWYWRVRATDSGLVGTWSQPNSFTVEGPLTPVLISPAHNATVNTKTPELVWNSSANATGYDLQISTVSNFSSIARSLSTPDTSWVVDPALENRTYYWRVRATLGDVTSAWSSNQTLNVNTLTPTVLLSPSNLETLIINTPELIWESVAEANGYDVQVSVSATFTTTARSTSTTTTSWIVSPNLNNGTYYWRVRAKDGSVVSSWSQSSSFTIAGPGIPVLSSPGNNATVNTKTPEFVWNSSANATSYELQISTVSNFSSIARSLSTTDTSWVVDPALENRTYYWRVRATMGEVISNWSNTRPVNINTLTAPVLLSPSDLETVIFNTPELTWESVADAQAYDVQVSVSATFTTTTRSTSTSATSWIVSSSLNNGTYYWRVRAKDGAVVSSWSETPSLTIQAPLIPVLSSPANNATVNTKTPELVWNSSANAEGYELQISTVSNFSSLERSINTPDTSWIVDPALENRSYYWRVRATLGEVSSNWSSSRIFNINTLTAPVLLSPSDQAALIVNAPELIWESVADAQAYDVQVSISATFISISRSMSTTATTWIVSASLNNGTYYWRVRAKDGAVVSSWSQSRSLTIQAPLTPVLSSPANNATVNTKTPELVWNSSANATAYEVQISTVSNFSSLERSINTTDTSWIVDPALANRTYYWRVRATLGEVSSTWTSNRAFTINTLTAPVLLSPSDQAALIVSTPELTWESVADAPAYDVQVSTSATFISISRSMSTTATSWIVSASLNNGTYYWRVRAKDGAVVSSWSQSRSFTIEALSAPILNSPANQAIVGSPNLSWGSVNQATGYDVEVSSTNTFSNIDRSANRTNTSWTVDPTLENGLWYWRVRAKNEDLIGAWSEVRSFTLNALDKPILISPANGAALDTLLPIVSWELVEGATSYDVYVSSQPNFATLHTAANLSDTQRRIWLVDHPTGPWYWIVRGRNGSLLGPWSEVRSFNINTLIAPALFYPNYGTYTNPSPNFLWSSVNGATSYEIEISPNSNFSDIYRSGSSEDTNWTASLPLEDGLWYWRVRAKNELFNGRWSATHYFRSTVLSPPILISPEDTVTLGNTTPTLSWQPVDGATGYQVYVSNSPTFTSSARTGNPIGTEWAVSPALPSGTWYWIVRAKNNGGFGPWSEKRVFTLNALNAPILLSPNNGATVSTSSPFLDWDMVDGAALYDVQVSTVNNFSAIQRSNTLIGTSWTVAPALANGTYYWRVQAKTGQLSSAWSAVRSFTVQINLTTHETLAFFNPSTGGASLLNTLQDQPLGSAYNNFNPGAPINGQWVMGDWDGNGTDTPAVFADGAVYLTNTLGATANWSAHWIGPAGTLVAGRFNPALAHDCLGVIEQTFLDPFTVFVLYYACDFTTNTPTVTWHWMSAALYDTAALPGLDGAWQFAIGDWNNDGAETPAVRRGPYVAFSNVPIVDPNFTGSPPFSPNNTGAEFAFAQYIGAPYDAEYGQFVTGDWNGNGTATFGLFYPSIDHFYYYNNLDWIPGAPSLQRITNAIGNPRHVIRWRPVGSGSLTADPEQPLQSLGDVAPNTGLESLNPLEALAPQLETLQPLD